MLAADQIPELLNSFLTSHPEIHTCLLYGSSVNGNFRRESDIDVAIASDRPLNSAEAWKLIGELSDLYGDRRIDLVDLSRIDGLLLREILTKGKILKRDTIFLAKRLTEMFDYFLYYYPHVKRNREARIQEYLHG